MAYKVHTASGITSQDLQKILGKQWYHQRFDGCPFFITLISLGECRPERRKMSGGENLSHVCWFGKGTTDWLIEQDDIIRISQIVFDGNFDWKKIEDKQVISKLNDMEKKQELIRINLPSLEKTKWYHQQADGCLFYIQLIILPYTDDKEKRRKDMDYKHFCVFMKDNIGHWYHDMNDIKRVTEQVSEKAQEKDFSKKLMAEWKEDEEKFFKKSKEVGEINLSPLSDKELEEVFVDYVESYLNSVTSSSIIDGFALGTDEVIQIEIRDFLERKGMLDKQYKYFTILTAPVTQSFINEGELSLLNIGRLIEEKKDFEQALTEHTQSYFWLKNNYYSSYVLTESNFLKEIKGMLDGNVNLQKEIDRIKNTPIKNKKDKETLINELNLPLHLRNLLTTSEDFTFWQDERKRKTFWMTHFCSLILEEIGKRFGYSLEELKYMIYPEVKTIFSGHALVGKEETRQRIGASLFYQKGDEFEIISGEQGMELKKQIFDKEDGVQVNDFRGLPASRGKVRGKVKILMSVQELDKMEQGDILVAVMTRPDYMAGIKRAAAIITNEGGVTCHAAIVSRELGIPCVIGTKIATKVLKDGDEVEVNANHGVVTIIKRS